MRLSPSKILDERFRVRLLLADIVDGEEKEVMVDTQREVGEVIEENREVSGEKEKVTAEERVNIVDEEKGEGDFEKNNFIN